MVRIRYTLGTVRLYGITFERNVWTEATPQMLIKIKREKGWEVEGEEVVEETVKETLKEEIEEVVEEATEEVVDETIDLSTLTKKELQALCNEKGLEYKAFDTKSTLISLLSDEEE